jgi:HEAT repeat protein
MLSSWQALIQSINQDHYERGHLSIASMLAQNGQEALQQIELHKPEVIILDCHMPILDGYAVCRLARQMADYHPFIVMVSGDDSLHEDRQSLEAGADRFLFKDEVHSDTLIDILLSFLENAHFKMQARLAETPTSLVIGSSSPLHDDALDSLHQMLHSTADQAGIIIVEMSIRWRAYLPIDRSQPEPALTPAGEAFWRNVYHSLGSILLKDAIAKWNRMTSLAKALSLPLEAQNEQLRRLTFSADKEIQLAALEGLGINQVHDALYILIGAAHSEDEEIRHTAIKALGALGDARGIPTLKAALQSSASILRYAALNALSTIGTTEALDIIRHSLESADSTMRVDAIRSFVLSGSRIEATQVIAWLAAHLPQEQDETVFYALVMTLRDLAHPQAIPLLKQIAHHESEVVSRAAHKALAKLNKAEV